MTSNGLFTKRKKEENRFLVSVYVLLRINCIQNSAGDVHAKLLFCSSNPMLSAVVVAVVLVVAIVLVVAVVAIVLVVAVVVVVAVVLVVAVVVVVAIVLVVASAPFVARPLSSLWRLTNE